MKAKVLDPLDAAAAARIAEAFPPTARESAVDPRIVRELCERLKIRVPAIIVDWQEIVREEAGRRLPKDYSLTALAEVVLGLVEASLCKPADVGAEREQICAAGRHGASLRRHGVAEEIVFTEFDLLRRAIWHHLQRLEPDCAVATALIGRIDQAITLATTASLYGHARPPDWETDGDGAGWVDRLLARGCP